MTRAIILYSTTDGHTIEITKRIRTLLEDANQVVTLMPIGSVAEADMEAADKVLIGASIRYGKHKKEVFDFVARNLHLLEQKPSAFFTVNAVARKSNKNTPDTNPYLRKFLAQVNWRPDLLGVFAGKIDYQKYGFLDKTMIRFIMYMTKGPTDPKSATDFTDWDRVEEFGRLFSDL